MQEREQLERLERKVGYMERRMQNMIQEEIRDALSEVGFKKFLFSIAGDFVKDNIKIIIESMVKEVFSKQTAIFKEQNKIISDLSLSIDKNVKKIIREIDCSYITNDIIKEKINTVFLKLENKMCENINKQNNKLTLNPTKMKGDTK